MYWSLTHSVYLNPNADLAQTDQEDIKEWGIYRGVEVSRCSAQVRRALQVDLVSSPCSKHLIRKARPISNNIQINPLLLWTATLSTVTGCSSGEYSRMCTTTESPYEQVLLCQPYYASDEGQSFLKQRDKRDAERAKTFDRCMADEKYIYKETRRTKQDCIDQSNVLVPRGIEEPQP
jgi:hypothetical protein